MKGCSWERSGGEEVGVAVDGRREGLLQMVTYDGMMVLLDGALCYDFQFVEIVVWVEVYSE